MQFRTKTETFQGPGEYAIPSGLEDEMLEALDHANAVLASFDRG